MPNDLGDVLQLIESEELKQRLQLVLSQVLGDYPAALTTTAYFLDKQRAAVPATRPMQSLGQAIIAAQRLAIVYRQQAHEHFERAAEQDAVLAIVILALASRAADYHHTGGFVRRSAMGETLPEGALMLAAAVQHGLSTNVLNGLASQSDHARILPDSLEGVIAWYAVRTVVDLLLITSGAPILMKRRSAA